VSKPVLIHETIVTTRSGDGSTHIVPLGIRHAQEFIVLAPFRPSSTLENMLRERHAVVNISDDVRVFAGCLTGRRHWPLVSAEKIPGMRLASALAHQELALDHVEDDEERPRLHCRVVHSAMHAPFQGYNRAQAAVIEACILVSRLHMLSEEKVHQEIDYLSIAVNKTAGARETEAWQWLMERIASHHAESRRLAL
jgi:hypothetical protein